MKKILLSALCLFALNSGAQTYFSDDFNDGNLNGWTLTDADGDTRNWTAAAITYPNGANASVMRSFSWQNNVVLTPNNWAVTSAIDLTAATGTTQLKWKVSAIDPAWDIEKYTVYVGTSSDIATLQSSTTSFTENTLNGVNLLTDRFLDVSAFNGQTIYVAFRHYGVSDQFSMEIDDVKVEKVNPNDAQFVSLTNFAGTYELNSSVTFEGVVRNYGNNNITSLDIEWAVNGGTANSQTFSGLNIAPGQTYNFTHATAWTASPAGNSDISFNITSVNSSEDPNQTNNTFDTSLLVVNEIFAKKVVYEEGTGTWCQFCPRGLVGLKDMSHLYPETFIGIAVHNADPMANAEYDGQMGNFIGGYPSGLLNRNTTEVDPGLGSLQPAFLTEANKIPACKVEVSFQSWNAALRQVTFTASATFALDLTNANYNIAAVIVENDVTGTSTGYNQVNAYAGGGLGPLVDYEGINWASLPNPIPASTIAYDHVGRELLGGWNGVSGVIPSSVTYNTQYATNFVHTLPTTQDENEIELVVFVIDNATGQIVNANKVDMGLVLSNDNFASQTVKIYPNPTNGLVNLNIDEVADLVLIDMMGKVVLTKNLSSGNNSIQMDSLPKGVYFAKIKGATIDTVEKIVLQ